ncbi:glycosyltransferase [Paraburkholderia sp. SIMBA_053]|uniref:glycosyltransferase n=2 Tax=Paraburkholderia TaxID=1822464 RepID=UPI00397E8DFC
MFSTRTAGVSTRICMDNPRLLITTYYSAFLNPGGGETELLTLIEGLRVLGVDADLYGPSSKPLSSYSSVLHFSVQADGLVMLQRARSQRKKIFLWPNLWWNAAPTPEERELVASFFRLSDTIIFKSESELENIRRYVPIDDEQILEIPVPVNSKFYNVTNPGIFKKMYGLDHYVLWVGVLNRTKNQLTAINALKDLDIPVVFIGHPNDEAYFSECRAAAPSHFLFIPQMPPASEILCSAVQSCTLFLEASLEPPGTSALEAALAGRPLVLSEGPWTTEHMGSHVRTINPRSEDSIRSAVRDALRSPAHGETLSRDISRRHLSPRPLVPFVDLIKRNMR